MKAGWLNVTLTNYRNADALDGVLGAARNTDVSPTFGALKHFPAYLIPQDQYARNMPIPLDQPNGRAQPFRAALILDLA